MQQKTNANIHRNDIHVFDDNGHIPHMVQDILRNKWWVEPSVIQTPALNDHVKNIYRSNVDRKTAQAHTTTLITNNCYKKKK